MVMPEKVLVSWSGGKDSALALYEARKLGLNVQALITAFKEDCVTIHGVRQILLEQQAEALGLPLEAMPLAKDASNKDFENEFLTILRSYLKRGVTTVVFGDLFLEDIKQFRDDMLAKIGMKGIYPLWKKDTYILAHEFIRIGFKAIVIATDGNVLGKEFAGREYNAAFLADLPANVDPCGENGEFHTFVYDGPIFSRQVKFTRGEIALRDNRFWNCELTAAHDS
jgi:uncharacterized protein (TIGR00290 family)